MKAKIAGASLTLIVLSGCASTAGNQSIKMRRSKVLRQRSSKVEPRRKIFKSSSVNLLVRQSLIPMKKCGFTQS